MQNESYFLAPRPTCGSMQVDRWREPMVRGVAIRGETRLAAACTAAIPRSFALSGLTGLGFMDGPVTVVDRMRTDTPGPLILPILGPRGEGKSRSASRSTTGSSKRSAVRRSPKEESRAAAVLSAVGFGLAWVATTGAGSVLCGSLLARHFAPAPVVVTTPAAIPPPPAIPAPCACEPPLVSVNDLPVAPPLRPAVAVHPVAPAPVVRHPVEAAASRTATRHVVPAGPAPAAPKSLEDWIRSSVASDLKKRP